MPRKVTDDSSFMTWTSDKIENDCGVDCYSSCIINEFVVSIGDFVYVSNPDEPYTKRLDIVEITHLYEIVDPLALDYKYQAVVESYRRPDTLPSELIRDVQDLDRSNEVIHEPSDIAFSLPLSSVRGKCQVMLSEPSQNVTQTMANINTRNKRHVYICRYRIVNRNGKLSLVAINDQHQYMKTPSKFTVSPIKIVNQNSVQKVSKLRTQEIENVATASDSETDEPSPAKVHKPSPSSSNNISFGARRNLNSSLNDAGADMIMGSIVVSPNRKKDELKMTIKVTRKGDASGRKNSSNTPLKAIQYNNNELDTLSKRQSATKRRLQAEPSMSLSYTPTKTSQRIGHHYGTPNQENQLTGTPKSILKSCSIRLSRTTATPRRSISFALNSQDKTALPAEKSDNVSASVSPTKSPLRRSKRRSSIYQINLAESPLDTSFISQEDSNFGSPEKQTRKTSVTTPKHGAKQSAINQTPNKTPKKSANRGPVGRSLDLNDIDESPNSIDNESLDDTLETPPKRTRKTPKKTPTKTPTKTPSKTPKRTPSARISSLEPVIGERKTPIRRERSDVQLAKESLHVSAVPKSLPCRENEFRDAYKFIEGKILDESGGCMYVSGVPGTGKTATITEVIRTLQLQAKQKKIPQFEFIEINGMRLTEPRQAYVQIYQQLTGTKVTSEQAHSLLDKRFSTPHLHRKTTVLLVDELDILCNRRQDVIYNLLDWPARKAARLVVVTIANTMDLPERLLMGRVTSRLGLTRLTFQPYTHKQLQEVVQARLTGTNIFENDAVQLVARKVASISGDCRRALDICRRATEIAESDCSGKRVMVSMLHVQKAFNEMITNPKVLAIKGCSKYEKFFLQAVEAEVVRTGVDETVLCQVYQQLESICAINGVSVPEPGIALRLSCRLGSSRLLICEHSNASIHQKIMLNVTSDDIYYALHVQIE